MKLLTTTALLSAIAVSSALAESTMEFTWTLAGSGDDTSSYPDPVCEVTPAGATVGALSYHKGRNAYTADDELSAFVRVNQAVELIVSLKDGKIKSIDTTAAAEDIAATEVKPYFRFGAVTDTSGSFRGTSKLDPFDLDRLQVWDLSSFAPEKVHEANLGFQPHFHVADGDAKHLTNGQGYEATLILTCVQSAT
jgi:hypothetical protein